MSRLAVSKSNRADPRKLAVFRRCPESPPALVGLGKIDNGALGHCNIEVILNRLTTYHVSHKKCPMRARNNLIRIFRVISNLRQADLATACKVNQGTISRLERGCLTCRPALAEAIAGALKQPVSTLFEESKNGQ
jgi:DNA-binding XRE family transcriptional regulator